MTRLEAFLTVFTSVVLRRPQGRHSYLAQVSALAPVSDDTAPFPLPRNPYPQEPQ